MDRENRTAMHYAALENDDDSIRGLLASGEQPDPRDRQGFTPLHLAAQQSAAAAVEALLVGGATVDSENVFGNTPLFVAVFNYRGNGDIIEMLRSHGADPSHANGSGQTPVGLARLIANYDVARFFVDVVG